MHDFLIINHLPTLKRLWLVAEPTHLTIIWSSKWVKIFPRKSANRGENTSKQHIREPRWCFFCTTKSLYNSILEVLGCNQSIVGTLLLHQGGVITWKETALTSVTNTPGPSLKGNLPIPKEASSPRARHGTQEPMFLLISRFNPFDTEISLLPCFLPNHHKNSL